MRDFKLAAGFALVFFFALALVGPVQAAGYWINGKCYPDSASTVVAFNSMYPKFESFSATSVTNVVLNAGVLSYTGAQRDFWGGLTSGPISVSLAACSVEGLPDSLLGFPSVSVFDPVIGAAFFNFALAFVVGCFLIARNAGVIIDIVKRW